MPALEVLSAQPRSMHGHSMSMTGSVRSGRVCSPIWSRSTEIRARTSRAAQGSPGGEGGQIVTAP